MRHWRPRGRGLSGGKSRCEKRTREKVRCSAGGRRRVQLGRHDGPRLRASRPCPAGKWRAAGTTSLQHATDVCSCLASWADTCRGVTRTWSALLISNACIWRLACARPGYCRSYSFSAYRDLKAGLPSIVLIQDSLAKLLFSVRKSVHGLSLLSSGSDTDCKRRALAQDETVTACRAIAHLREN